IVTACRPLAGESKKVLRLALRKVERLSPLALTAEVAVWTLPTDRLVKSGDQLTRSREAWMVYGRTAPSTRSRGAPFADRLATVTAGSAVGWGTSEAR